MKQILNFLIFTMALCQTITAQQTWTVSNNPAFDADYTTVKDAVDAANAGDVILVDGTGLSYGIDTVDKAVSIIGPGNFFGAPEGESSYGASPALFDRIYFIEGSEGGFMSGVKVGQYLYIQDNNVVVKRNYISTATYVQDVFNTVIHQCYIGSINLSNAQNILITQNIINYIGYSNSSTTIENNTILSMEQNLQNSLVRNNIIYRDNNCTTYDILPSNNNTIENNIIVCTNSYVNSSNQTNVDVNNLFVGYPNNPEDYSTDARFQLADSSPAIGAADDGGDCGAFGGLEPYQLSGIPAIPIIYDFNAPTSGSENGGLEVEVKVRTNN